MTTPQQSTSFGGGYRPGLVTITDPVSSHAEFLASQNYTVKRAGITLAAAAWTADSNGDKIVKGGTVLALATGGTHVGKYVPYVNAGANGAGTPAGLLFAGDLNLRYGDLTASLLIDGSVMEARLTGLDSGAKTALAPHFTFQ